MFPDNIIEKLQELLISIDGVNVVLDSDLVPSDPNGAVGVTFDSWRPIDYEIGSHGPAISEYSLVITHLVKSMARAAGEAESRSVARSIRSMLYRDPITRDALGQLAHTDIDLGSIERTLKWELDQKFIGNKINSSFYFVSETQLRFQTQSS